MPWKRPAADAFGDRFDLAALPLPRPAIGYGVQQLDTDRLLDRHSGQFAAIRSSGLAADFASFDEAFAAAAAWTRQHCADDADPGLAIVPLGYDPVRRRPILIYGVLCRRP